MKANFGAPFVFVRFAVSFVLVMPLVALAYEMKGTVVRERSSDGITDVVVDVRYQKDGNVQTTTRTVQGGNYSFVVPNNVSRVFITYTPRDLRRHSTDGRESVRNNTDPKTLDTVGLVEFQRTSVDLENAAAETAAEGAINYVNAGGSQQVAKEAVNGMPERFRQAIRARPLLNQHMAMKIGTGA